MDRLILLLAFPVVSLGADLYVAPGGNDAGPGTLRQPFATLERARDAARRQKQVRIHLRGGVHYLARTLELSAENSGTASAPVIYQAYPGEEPVLSGGVRLAGEWKPHAGPVLVCALAPGSPGFDELFVNGKRQPRARYPDLRLEDGFDQGHLTGLSAEEWPHRQVQFDPRRLAPRPWADPSQAVLHAFAQNYWGNLQWRIREVDWKRNAFLLGPGGWQISTLFQLRSATGLGPRSKYFVDSVFEELDAPGEWYLDRARNLLYYYPPPGLDVDAAVFEGSILRTLVALRGAKQRPVRHVQFRGLRFARTAPVYQEPYETPSLGDWTIHRSGAVLFDGAEDCGVEFCDFDAVGGNGVFVSNHARRIRVYGNRFSESGESAVCLVGKSHLDPQRRYRCPHCGAEHWWGWGEPSGEHPEECLVSNNLMRNLGVHGKQTAGVFLSIAAKNTVSHNRISNVPRAAICLNDGFLGGHIIEFNDIFKTVNETGDHGPFNSWGRERAWCRYQSHPTQRTPEGIAPQGQGGPHHEAADYLQDARYTTHIRNNRFRDRRGWGIDLDDGSSNYHVYNNLCIGISVKLREGDHRQVYNNIFIKPANPPSFHVGYLNNHDRFVRNIIVVSVGAYVPESDIDFQPEKSAGAIYDLIRPPRAQPWLREIDHNLFFSDTGEFRATARLDGGERASFGLDQWRALGFDRNGVFADPLFADPARGDYRLKPDSPARKLGIRELDLRGTGLRLDFPAAWRQQAGY